MSGCGRKHRAKHLTRQFLDAAGWTGPAPGESMAVCVESPQGQHVRVLMFAQPSNVDVAEGIGATDDSSVEEHVVFVPGKFYKVIWLAVRDIIVVADRTTVAFKPSPDQLKVFFRSNPAWRSRLTSMQEKVDGCRRMMEQRPQYVNVTHTMASLLPKVMSESGEGKDNKDDRQLDECGVEAEGVHMNPNRNNIRHKAQFFYGHEGDDDDDEEEEEREDVE